MIYLRETKTIDPEHVVGYFIIQTCSHLGVGAEFIFEKGGEIIPSSGISYLPQDENGRHFLEAMREIIAITSKDSINPKQLMNAALKLQQAHKECSARDSLVQLMSYCFLMGYRAASQPKDL